MTRGSDAAPQQLPEMVRAAFGETQIEAVTELAGGRYNRTFRVALAGRGPVVLRVAPEPARQLWIEQTLMRNEVAAVPFLKPIERLMPQLLATDFSHQIIDADYLFQEFLPGIPGPDALPGLVDAGPFWMALGEILSRIHAVTGPAFGRVQGPHFPTWNQALANNFAQMAQDLDDAGLVAADIRSIGALLARHRDVVNEASPPRLLHGDLWIGNVLLSDSTAPQITSVVDSDRASWGDPAADWTFHLLRRRSSIEKDQFWRGYGGKPDEDAATGLRRFFYQARSLGEGRLEYHRLGMADKAAATYPRLERELDKFTALQRR